MINTISSRNSDATYTSSKTIPAAAYIHIPFCRRRCYYCDFPISVVGQGKSTLTMVEDYLAALIKEIQLTHALRQPLTTVFLAGGLLPYLIQHSFRKSFRRSLYSLVLPVMQKSRWKSIQVLLIAIAYSDI